MNHNCSFHCLIKEQKQEYPLNRQTLCEKIKEDGDEPHRLDNIIKSMMNPISATHYTVDVLQVSSVDHCAM